jgi:hypothetical protein
MFTGFPRGLPGTGLLLLRVAVSLSILFPEFGGSNAAHSTALQIASAFLTFMLLVGFLTPITAFVYAALQIARIPSGIAAGLISSLTACALAMTGGGAYSIDALLFGRRKLVVRSTPGEKNH